MKHTRPENKPNMSRNIQKDIMRYNRNPVLSQWFQETLAHYISHGYYTDNIEQICNRLIEQLTAYKNKNSISTVVIGISGGIDSAVTAALFKQAGYRVIGVTLPIHQNPQETARGVEACESLGLDHIQVDLSEPYDGMLNFYQSTGLDFSEKDFSTATRMRAGNIRARLRMITLYNLASRHKGFVASTDNFSELAAGFWTLHGDVGDVAPIQSLTKSWEVPALAEYLGVPASIVNAVPTDGLGISSSDEAQFGFSYLEFDIVLMNLIGASSHTEATQETDLSIINNVKSRLSATRYKRNNPMNLLHPVKADRFNKLSLLDSQLDI